MKLESNEQMVWSSLWCQGSKIPAWSEFILTTELSLIRNLWLSHQKVISTNEVSELVLALRFSYDETL